MSKRKSGDGREMKLVGGSRQAGKRRREGRAGQDRASAGRGVATCKERAIGRSAHGPRANAFTESAMT